MAGLGRGFAGRRTDRRSGATDGHARHEAHVSEGPDRELPAQSEDRRGRHGRGLRGGTAETGSPTRRTQGHQTRDGFKRGHRAL